MKRIVLRSLLTMILSALFHGRPILAAECAENAAVPRPVTVGYAPTMDIEFMSGADGVLRALNARNGQELWVYTPPGLDVTQRFAGLMTDIRALRFDTDANGSIDPAAGDRVWLYFGLRRGGRFYYALDVTDHLHPQLLWQIGPAELPGVGETWSAPTLARMRIAGEIQNGEALVAIFGGGFDEVPGASGHRIFIVDAQSGRLLWYAGGPGGTQVPLPPDLLLPSMVASVAGRVAAIDVDRDGYTDRLYAADLGGQVWRLDLTNGANRSALAAGGVIASIGGLASPAPEDARRFFNGPDVALIQRRGAAPFYNLGIGSGDRAQPFGSSVYDRFYSIRDWNPFGKLTQAAYDAMRPLGDADFFDITDHLTEASIPLGAPGWKLELRMHGGWLGEKVLAESVTLDGVILFSTFEPAPASDCADSGLNRVYAVRVEQGDPALDLDDDERLTESDASVELEQKGIAGEVELKVPQNDAGDPPPNGEPTPDSPNTELQCAVGAEALRLCVPAKRVLRTFWQRDTVD